MIEDIEFGDPLRVLFEPKRYKILWGGRGAGRSWGIAGALLLMGAEPVHPLLRPPLRILCARELQKSIEDSVHQNLQDQIARLDLGAYYIVMRDEIRGVGKAEGTSFIFEGLKNNVTKIKSFEGIDLVWVEEAVHVSRRSWEILIPTIRKPNSEIWMSFNPELKTDYTYVNFVLNAEPSMSTVVHMTWRDNPWFPKVLERERDRLREVDYDAYLNVWEGQCREQLEGAVYARELRRATEENRICTVKWERTVPVDVFFDLGRADQTAMWFAQRVSMQTRVLAYYANSGYDITHYIHEMQSREYVYGTIWLPHDARAKQLGSKRSVEEIVRQAGYRVMITPNLSVPDGINAARISFPNCYFDRDECEEGLDALRHYRYEPTGQVDSRGNAIFSDKPVHDWASDGADAFRYLGVALHDRRRDRGAPGLIDRLESVLSRRRKDRERDYDRPFTQRDTHGAGWMR